MGSTISAPALRRSATALSNTSPICLKSSLVGLGRIAHRLAQDADPRALQRGLVERRRIAVGRIADAVTGHRIVGVVADHAVEQLRQRR